MTLEAAMTLAQASARTAERIDGALVRIGVDLRDLRRLRTIGAAEDGITWRDLAAAMAESRSQALRATRPLEKLGWVESADGRSVLTASGRHLLATGEEIAATAAQRWFAECGISAAEMCEHLRPLAEAEQAMRFQRPV